MTDTDALSELTEGYLAEGALSQMNRNHLNHHLITLIPTQHSKFYQLCL